MPIEQPQPNAAPCRNVVVHGAQSTGKSVVTEALLERMVEDGAELSYAVVNSVECITGRHLLETTINKVAESLHREDVARRCENLSQFSVELARMITSYARETERPASWRFVLVFDAIDRQRDSPPTLLPALARLSEIVSIPTGRICLHAEIPNRTNTWKLVLKDTEPNYRFHNDLPSGRNTPNLCHTTCTLPKLLPERVHRDNISKFPTSHTRAGYRRSTRLMVSICWSRIRLPRQSRGPNPARTAASMHYPLATFYSSDTSRNPWAS